MTRVMNRYSPRHAEGEVRGQAVRPSPVSDGYLTGDPNLEHMCQPSATPAGNESFD